MIGLISHSLSTVRQWRDRTKVDAIAAPWLRDRNVAAGMALHSVICLPGWEERPGNHDLLTFVQPRIVRAQADEVVDEALVNAEQQRISAIATRDEGSTPEPDSVERRYFPIDPPRRPNLGDEDDHDAMRRFNVANDLYDRMTPDERASLMALIRAPGNAGPAIRQYVTSVRRRYEQPEAERAIDANRRVIMIEEIVATGADRDILVLFTTADLEILYRMAQEMQVVRQQAPAMQADAAARFNSHYNNLREVYTAQRFQEPPRVFGRIPDPTMPPRILDEGPPTQRVTDRQRTRPPTSGPATGGRALPFSDIFRPVRNSAGQERMVRRNPLTNDDD